MDLFAKLYKTNDLEVIKKDILKFVGTNRKKSFEDYNKEKGLLDEKSFNIIRDKFQKAFESIHVH